MTSVNNSRRQTKAPLNDLRNGMAKGFRSYFLVVFVSLLVWFTILFTWETGQRLEGGDSSLFAVNIPAGVRMFIVLVSGIWGAIGVVLGQLETYFLEPKTLPFAELLSSSLISGLAPLAGLKSGYMMLGIKPDLRNLKPLHLPVLALSASATMALASSFASLVFERLHPDQLLPDILARTASDFAGTLVVVAVILFAVKLFRWTRPQRSFH